MTTETERATWPDPARPDVAVVRIRRGDGEPPFDQPGSWPEGLLSFTGYTNENGWFSYEQWTTEPEPDGSEYRLYRSGTRPDTPVPGCIVLVSVEFDGPDEARQKRWVDLVFEALGDEETPHPGGISAHFHLSDDGTRIANYAEWRSEADHIEAIESSGQGTVGKSPKFEAVKTFPGVVAGDFQRFRPVVHRTAAEQPKES
ncbi:antibiotic biosynthesis monooxygenase [Amycolatopsis sp. NBC_00345]|uniref:antibiotic biosynthesis monooxygenase n=1 Tax=Amycolatopsis sp. NBC_00345 TaxID=2975955 RepID=UPI002E255DFB